MALLGYRESTCSALKDSASFPKRWYQFTLAPALESSSISSPNLDIVSCLGYSDRCFVRDFILFIFSKDYLLIYLERVHKERGGAEGGGGWGRERVLSSLCSECRAQGSISQL